MKKNLTLLILLLALICFMIGCAPKPFVGIQKIIETPSSRPDWITKVPKTKKGIMYFCGIKTHASNLGDGLADARMHAERQVVEIVKEKANVIYKNICLEYGISQDDKDVDTVIQDGLALLASAAVQGLRGKEIYYEKIQEITADRITYFYNCYVLASISEEVYCTLANQIFKQQKIQAQTTENEKVERFIDAVRESIVLGTQFKQE